MRAKLAAMDRPLSSVPKPFYKPLATRTPVLIIYLLASLALLGLTEYACQHIPQHSGIGSFSSVVDDTLGALRHRADDRTENVPFKARAFLLHWRNSSTSASPTSMYQTVNAIANGGSLSLGASTSITPPPTISETLTTRPGKDSLNFTVSQQWSNTVPYRLTRGPFLSFGEPTSVISSSPISETLTPSPSSFYRPTGHSRPTSHSHNVTTFPNPSDTLSMTTASFLYLKSGPFLSLGEPTPVMYSPVIDQTSKPNPSSVTNFPTLSDIRQDTSASFGYSKEPSFLSLGEPTPIISSTPIGGTLTPSPDITTVQALPGGQITTMIAVLDGGYPSITGTAPVISTPTVVQTLSPAVVQTLTPAVIQTLTPAVIQTLTPAVIQTLTPAVIQTFPAVVQTLTQAAVQTLTPAVVQILTPAVIQTLPGAVGQTLTPAVVQTLTPAIVQTLTQAVVLTLTPAVVKTLKPAIVQTLPAVVQTLPAVVQTLTPAVVQLAAGGSAGTLTTGGPSPTPGVESTGFLSVATADIVLTNIVITKLSTSYSTSTNLDGNIIVLASTASVILTEAVFTARSSIYPIATTVNSTGTYITTSDGSSQIIPQINAEQYVIVAFVPMLLALLFTLPWHIIDKTIREMEPFYQLRNSRGSTAEKSLLLDYSTSLLITMPLKSLFRRHYIVCLSSVISLIVLVVAPLSSEVLFVSLSGSCVSNVLGNCHATWGVYPALARAMEGVLGFVAFLLLAIIIFNFRRKSGVYANPLSIVGLGTLLQNPDLQQEFAALDSTLSNSALKRTLTGRVYKLAETTNGNGSSGYGITPMTWSGDLGNVTSSYDDKTYMHENPHGDFERQSRDDYVERRSPTAGLTEKLLLVAAFVLIAGILIVIIYYESTTGDTAFENFMDSQGFGVRLLMAILGVLVKLAWSTIDEDLRRLEPYRRLLCGFAKPEDSILVQTYMSPLSSLIPSLRNKHFLIFVVSLTALLSELLPITLANVPFSAATVQKVYTASGFVAIAILSLMLISLSILIFRPTHGLRHLPRKPTTVASVLLYLATQPSNHGGLLNSLAGLETMTASEIHKRVVGMEKLYALGWVSGGELKINEEGRK